MTFELSGEQCRTIIFYEWKNSSNNREKHACLVAAVGRKPSIFEPHGSQLISLIRAWDIECLRRP